MGIFIEVSPWHATAYPYRQGIVAI
jgi:hypothetical protein